MDMNYNYNKKYSKEELLELGEAYGFDFSGAIYRDGALWKGWTTPDTETMFLVSTDGRVYNADTGHYREPKPQVYSRNTYGRRAVQFRALDGRKVQSYIYRMVAETFIPNPDNLPTVNHKDENPTNDVVFNLEWMTVEDNMNYGTCRQRGIETRRANSLKDVLTPAEIEMSQAISKNQ